MRKMPKRKKVDHRRRKMVIKRNGKKFRRYQSGVTKLGATNLAKSLRKEGYLARIVKRAGKEYVVFKGPKRR